MSKSDSPRAVLAPFNVRVIIVCGLLASYLGLGLCAMGDDDFTRFLGAAMAFTGTILALPQMVAQVLIRQSNH